MDILVILALILATLAALFIWTLLDVARQPAHAFGPAGVSKGATVGLLLLSGGLGAVYYLVRVRPIVSRTARSTPPPPSYRTFRKGDDPWGPGPQGGA